MKLIKQYTNGNAKIKLYSDGTREIFTEDDEFKFDYPLSMDCKVTNFCHFGCPQCHENSTPNGRHALMKNFDFLETWNKGCEIALGGGALSTYTDLDKLLIRIKKNGLIASATFHQQEFIDNFNEIRAWQKNEMLYGIGVSLHSCTDELAKFINQCDNVVIHVINGMFTFSQCEWIAKNIRTPKILILGYKEFRRGIENYSKNKTIIDQEKQWLKENLRYVLLKCKAVSFDNLALEQLDVKSHLTDKQFSEFYQGGEGELSMYIDAVEGKFARNSTSNERYLIDKKTVKEMFYIIKVK